MPAALLAARPAVAALVLVAAVAVTGLALSVFWPLGVVLGLALGGGAVLAFGTRMEVADRLQPADRDLAEQLGIEPEPAAAADPAAEPAQPVPAQPVPAQPDVLYFTFDEDPDRAEARTVVRADADKDADAAPLDLTGTGTGTGTGPIGTDLDSLREELGADYPDFARAARLVVSTQYASAARLQRELDLPYARARRLLTGLEQQHFVGPATGSLPRRVLMPKERLPEVERLLAEV